MFTAIGVEESRERERRRDQLGYRKGQGHKGGWAVAKESIDMKGELKGGFLNVLFTDDNYDLRKTVRKKACSVCSDIYVFAVLIFRG